MGWCKWEELPEFMRTQEVRPYYEALSRHRGELRCKRVFDVVCAGGLLLLLSPVFVLLGFWIKLDSRGPVFYRQLRVTQYGKEFLIYKFRTMEEGADKKGSLVTGKGDARITRAGRKLRRSRVDELPQLINILKGEMSFVGTRPEVPRYVREYTGEMYATLLLPAGVTSEASIRFKDEDSLLEGADDLERAYVQCVLPRKMEYNLNDLRKYSLKDEIKILFETLIMIVK